MIGIVWVVTRVATLGGGTLTLGAVTMGDTSGVQSIGGGTGGQRPDTDTTDTRSPHTRQPQVWVCVLSLNIRVNLSLFRIHELKFLEKFFW